MRETRCRFRIGHPLGELAVKRVTVILALMCLHEHSGVLNLVKWWACCVCMCVQIRTCAFSAAGVEDTPRVLDGSGGARRVRSAVLASA